MQYRIRQGIVIESSRESLYFDHFEVYSHELNIVMHKIHIRYSFFVATRDVHRPTRNGTYIRFVDASNNATVVQYDAGWSPSMIYTGNTIIIYTNYSWIPGRSYYVLFDSGKFIQSNKFSSEKNWD